MIPKEAEEQIKQQAELLDVVSDHVHLKKSGSSHVGDCPFCMGKKKLSVTPAKEVWKCFKCEKGGKGAISFVMELQGISYPDALEELGNKYGISTKEKSIYQLVPKKNKGVSFRDLQLKASGIPIKEQAFKLKVDGSTTKVDLDRYQSGGIDEYWNIVPDKDDMLLNYLDLDGELMTFQRDTKSKQRPFFRVRFKNPELPENRTKDGKVRKYAQPGGSGTHLWLPNALIKSYIKKEKIDTLHIIEGEKKADKMCLHGMPTVGIGGIHNLASNNALPRQFQLLLNANEPKKVVFWLDADWCDLGNDPDKPADSRPLVFWAAVRNFRDYFQAFKNEGIHLHLYFGYLKKDYGQKGMDDLLADMKGEEKQMADDISQAMNLKDGDGEYVTVHNITEKTHSQLKEYWHLHSTQAFIQHHKEELQERGTFQVGKFKWKFNEEGQPEPDMPILPHEQYWTKETRYDRGGNEKVQYLFNYQGSRVFLRNRGFARLKMTTGDHQLVEVNDKVVKEVKHTYIKDYVLNYTEDVVQQKDVLEMLLRNSSRYYGPEQLGNMYVRDIAFVKNDAETQYLFFQEKYWKVNKEGVEEAPLAQLPGYVWQDKLKAFNPSILDQPMIRVTGYNRSTGQVKVEVNEDAYDKCHFAIFLQNTSDFYWKETNRGEKPLEPEKARETTLHLIGKLSAIGFMLHRFRDPNVLKLVAAVDGRMSEVGKSQGRSGKSIVGDALGEVINSHYINGKSFDPDKDPFAFEGVDERTDMVFLDDVRVNFKLEPLYPHITGKFGVNPKGHSKYYLPKELTPKIFLTTNHSLIGNGDSDLDRQILIAFSDYYSKDYKPLQEFEQRFFDDWSWEQWNLFYNLMACCLQIYFQWGIIEPPMERVEKRRLRQDMGEVFVQWADDFFHPDNDQVNCKHERKALMDHFLEEYPQQKKYINARNFKHKVKLYASYRDDLQLNPHIMPAADGTPGDWKTGGHEYFVLADDAFNANVIRAGVGVSEVGLV